jgi:hypothetical protein
MVRFLILGMLLSSSLAGAQASGDETLASGPYSRMGMKYEKTFLGVDVAQVDVQFDDRTQAQLRRLAEGHEYSDELGAKIAQVALGADNVLVQLRFLRNVSFSDYLDGARRNLTRARDAGLISERGFAGSWQRVNESFGRFKERGFKKGDRIYYRAHPGSLRTTVVASSGEVLLDVTVDDPEARLSMLGGYFAPGSDFRKPLVRSLFR